MLDLTDSHRETIRANARALLRVWGVPFPHERLSAATERVELASASGQMHLRVLSDSGRWISVHGRRPDDEARSWWENCSAGADSVTSVVMLGVGLGHGLLAALDSKSAPRVLVVEHEPGLAVALLAARDWRPWIDQQRMALVVGPDYLGLADFAARFASDKEPPLVVFHPALAREMGAASREAARAAHRLVQEGRQNCAARSVFAGRYLLQTVTNLSEILQGRVAGLTGIANGSPAVIAGAGPSLNRNIEELAQLRDRAVVIAAGSAMRPLVASGIEADLVVALDPADANARNLAGTGANGRTWLVGEGSLPPDIFKEYRGRSVSFRVGDHHPWPWLLSLGVDPGLLRAWGSVITSSFDLAVRMGCDPVVFVGADHAYTGGQPYCRDTTWEDDWACEQRQGKPLDEVWRAWKESRPVVTAPDIHGELVESAIHFLAYRDWLVDASVRSAPVRVINATGAGILHGGRIEQLSLSRALANRRRVAFPTGEALARRTGFDSRVGERIAGLASSIGHAGRAASAEWARDVEGVDGADIERALLAGIGACATPMGSRSR
jgi:hypothetical protein